MILTRAIVLRRFRIDMWWLAHGLLQRLPFTLFLIYCTSCLLPMQILFREGNVAYYLLGGYETQ